MLWGGAMVEYTISAPSNHYMHTEPFLFGVPLCWVKVRVSVSIAFSLTERTGTRLCGIYECGYIIQVVARQIFGLVFYRYKLSLLTL